MIAYGIDFGTTNTAVVERITTGRGASTTRCGENGQPFPSLVALHPEKPPLFGMEVKKRRGQLKKEGYAIISSFKSLLGRTENEPIKIRNAQYAPAEIASLFLQYVKDTVERQTGTPMTEAVISIPEDPARVRLMNYGGRPMTRENFRFEEFRSLISGRIEDAAQFLVQTAGAAGVTVEQLDAVLMVGGSCEMRPIIQRLEELGGERVFRPDHVQWVVASGAAILVEKQPVYQLQRDLGVLLSDGTVYPIFEAGQTVPCESLELSFGVVEDTTNAVFILADDRKTELLRLLVPIKGFTSEGLRLRASIDEDMIAHVAIRSTYAERMEVQAEICHLGFLYRVE